MDRNPGFAPSHLLTVRPPEKDQEDNTTKMQDNCKVRNDRKIRERAPEQSPSDQCRDITARALPKEESSTEVSLTTRWVSRQTGRTQHALVVYTRNEED